MAINLNNPSKIKNLSDIINENRQNDLEQSYYNTKDIQPDTSINDISLSKKTKIPTYAFAGNAENQKQVKDIAYEEDAKKINFKDIVDNAPNLSNQIQDSIKMSAVKDDLETLTNFEKAVRAAKQIADPQFDIVRKPLVRNAEVIEKAVPQFQKGQDQIRLAEAVERGTQSYLETGSFDNLEEIENISNKIANYPEVSKFSEDKILALTGQLSQQLPNMMYGTIEGAKEALKYGLAAGTIAGVAGGGFATPITASTGFSAGAKVGFFKGNFDAVKRLEKNLALYDYAQLENINPKEAERMAEIVGNINGAIEVGSNIILAKAGASLLSGVYSHVPKFIVNTIEKLPYGKQVASLLATKTNMPLRKAIAMSVWEATKGVASEVGEEVSQEITTAIGQEILEKGNLKDVDFAKITNQAMQVIAPTLQATVIPALLGIGVGNIVNIKQLGNLHDKTNIANKNADVANDIFKEVAKGTGAENAYVNVDKLEKAIVDSGLDLNETLNKLGITELYQEHKNISDEAGENNTLAKIKMNTADFLTKAKALKDATGIDLREKLNDDITWSRDELSVNDQKEVVKRVEEELPKEIEQQAAMVEEENQRDTEREAIYNDIKNELEIITKPETMTDSQWQSNIEANSKLWASHILTQSQIRGLSPQEVYQGMKPQIISKSMPQAREFLSSKKEFIKEIRQQTQGKIYIPEDVRGDWAEVKKQNPFLFTTDKAKAGISTDELSSALGISEDEIINRLMTDTITPLYQAGKDITQTEEFKTWFGDSKVVDENGKPLVVYHGTSVDFNEFKYEFIGETTGTEEGRGFYFTNDIETAKKYSNDKNIINSYLNIKKPLSLDSKKITKSQLSKFIKAYDKAEREMFDGEGGGYLDNWGDINYEGYEKVLKKAVDAEFVVGNDVDMIHSIMTSSGMDTALIYDVLNKTLGYDGIIAKDRLGKNIDVYVAFFPNQIKSVENVGTFSPETANIYQQSIKGSAQFPQGMKPIITLFESADTSTFIHESSHVWLKDGFDFYKTGQGTEQFKQLWKDLGTFLDIKEEQTELTTEQQEKFARSFEAYLMEGKAPNQYLRKAFRQFKNWLIRIYRSIVGLSQQAGFEIKMTDEVRYIMDRMLATEDEINFEARRMNYQNTIDFNLLSDGVSEQLDNLRQIAYDKAYGIMLKRLMRQEQDKQIKAIKKERKPIVLENLKKEPIYANSAIIEEKMKGKAKTLANKFLDLLKTTEHTEKQNEFLLEYNMTLENIGQDPIEFSNIIVNNPSLDEAVNIELNNYIEENHSELLDIENFREEAMNALHNDKSVEALGLEKVILKDLIAKSENKAQLEQYKQKVKSYRKSQIDFETETARVRADRLINNIAVKDAGKFMPYFTEERNYSIKADRALQEKDYVKAYDFKSKQIMNFALAKSSYQANLEIKKNLKYLDKVVKKDRKLFKNEKHFFEVANLLERFGFSRRDYTNQDRELRGEATLQTWLAGYENEGLEIADWLLDERAYDYKEVSLNRFRDFVNAIKQIQKVANNENKLFKNDQFDTLTELVNSVVPQTYENIKDAKRQKIKIKGEKPVSKLQFTKQKYQKIIDTQKAMLTKPDIIFNMLDGFKDDGVWQKTFIDRVREASRNESNMLLEKMNSVNDLYDNLYTKKEQKNLNKYVYYPALDQKFTKNELLSMALNLGNAGNRQNLFSGLFDLRDKNIVWNEQVAMEFLQANLTKNDWLFVQGVWDVMETMKEPISVMYREVNGFTPQFIDPLPFKVNLQDGTQLEMKGGYYPLVEDKRQKLGEALENLEDEPLYTEPNQNLRAYTPNGFTKQRSGALYPIRLDLGVIANHFLQVIHDLNFRKPIIDFNKILYNKDIQRTITENLGNEYYTELQEWIKAIGYGDRTKLARGDIYAFVKSLKSNITSATLAYKIPILTQNIANVALYANAVDGFTHKDALQGMMLALKYNTDFFVNRDEYLTMRGNVYDKSALMRNRAISPDITLKVKDNVLKEFGVRLMSITDEIFAIPMWITAYNKKILEGVSETTAINYADLLIERTLGSGDKYFTASKLKTKDWQSLFIMYMSFFNTQFNRMIRTSGQVFNNNDYLKAADYAIMTTAFVIMSEILFGNLPEDDEPLWQWAIDAIVRYPFGGVPIVRDVVNYGIPRLRGERGFDFNVSPLLSVVDDILKNTVDGSTAFMKGKKQGKDFVEGLVKSSFYITGLPMAASNTFFNSLDILQGDMNFQVKDLWKRRPKRERRF